MEFVRVESVQGAGETVEIYCIFRLTPAEYDRMINERNRQAEIERQNEIDRERERQWYADMGDRLSE